MRSKFPRNKPGPTEVPEELRNELTRVQMLKGMRLIIFQSIFGTSWFSLTNGVFFTGLALTLGASNFQIGILASLPALTNLFQPVASIFVEKLRRRKAYVVSLAETFRTLWTLPIFIPFFIPQDLWITTLVALIFLSSLAFSMAVPAWTVWTSDLVPENMRGRFFGRRNTVGGAVGMLVALGAGKVLDKFSGRPEGFPEGYNGFLIIFGVAFVFIALDTIFFLQRPEPPAKREENLSISYLWKIPFQDKNFLKFSLFIAFWSFATGIAAPFYAVFMIEELKINYSTIALFTALGTLSTILSYPFWGFLSDKFSNKPILKISTSIAMFLPILWMFNTKDNYQLIPVVHILGGMSTAAITLTSFNLLLRVTPEKRRSIYIAIYAMFSGIAAFIAPIAGGYLAEALSEVQLSIGNFPVGSLQIIFLLSSALTLISGHFFPDVKESSQVGAGEVIRNLWTSNPFSVFYNLYLFSRSDTESDRFRTARILGVLKSPLAVDDLIRALNDPSQEVRRQTARSLGEIGHKKALTALIEKLDDPEANIQPQAAWAIGQIGSHEGTKPLIDHLYDPDLQVRINSVMSLGKIGDRKAIDALKKLAQDERRNHQILPVVVDALAELGETDIVWLCFDAYPQLKSPIIKRQLLSSIAEMAGDGKTFYRLVGLDAYRRDLYVTDLLKSAGARLGSRSSFLAPRERAETRQVIQASINAYQRERYLEAVLVLEGLIDTLEDWKEGVKTSLKEDEQGEVASIALSLGIYKYLVKKSESDHLDTDEANLGLVAFLSAVDRAIGLKGKIGRMS